MKMNYQSVIHLIKSQDEDFQRYKSMKNVLAKLYYTSKKEKLTERQIDTIMRKYDEFKSLFQLMKTRYKDVKLNAGFVDWLNEFDDFTD